MKTCKSKEMKNILAIVAHPDDLEIMAGGTILKYKSLGAKIHVLVMTNGSWVSEKGETMRSIHEAKFEFENVCKFMGYDSYEMLNELPLHLEYKDNLVCEILKRITSYNIDSIITCWDKDANHDHSIVSQITKMAGKRVPKILMGQINYHMQDFFVPNFYIDITKYYNKKLESIKLYKSQWERNGKDWTEFLNSTSLYYGKIVGVKRAEGFVSNKFLL